MLPDEDDVKQYTLSLLLILIVSGALMFAFGVFDAPGVSCG